MCIFTLSLVSAIVRWVPQVGTFWEAFEIIKKEIPNEIESGKKLLDLWSGSWKVARFFADRCWLHVVGYEIDLGNWILANIYNICTHTKNVTFLRRNFFEISDEDLQTYDYIYIYLFPKLMNKIEAEILPRCKPGTKIIVNSFPFAQTKPEMILHRKNSKPIVYIYNV